MYFVKITIDNHDTRRTDIHLFEWANSRKSIVIAQLAPYHFQTSDSYLITCDFYHCLICCFHLLILLYLHFSLHART